MGVKTDHATKNELNEASKKAGNQFKIKRTDILEGAKLLTINPSNK